MGFRRRLISTLLTAAAAGFVAARPNIAFSQPTAPPAEQDQPAGTDAPPAPAGGTPMRVVEPATVTAVPATSPAFPTSLDVAGDVQRLAAVLTGPAARQNERDDAAARLASRQGPGADAVLLDALTRGSQFARIAVARALADDAAAPRQGFIDLLLAQLGGGETHSAVLAEAVANALANYRRNSVTLEALVRTANDTTLLPAVRIASVRALGRVVDPGAAQALVQIVNAPANERRDVRDAAGDALVDMTGLAENGRDARRWSQWLQQTNPVGNADAWRADVLEARASRLDRLRRRHESLAAELKVRLSRQYQALEPRQRQAALLEYLNSAEPEVRVIGTDFVTVAMQENEDISDAVRDRLVAMVGDSDAQVRLQTADTLLNMNYAGALGALLTQLAQERDDRVKVALAGAVAPIKDPSAAPALLDLLRPDAPPAVAVAAVRALGSVGRGLRSYDSVLADRVAARLRGLVRQRRNNPVPEELRVASLEALAPLKDPLMLELGIGLGNDPSAAVRQAAIRVLGDLGDDRASAALADVLQAARRDPETRKLALEALAKTGGMAYYERFYDYMNPRVETDAGVREAAWQALRSAMPRGSDQQLANTAQLLKADPDHRVVVFQALAERFRQRGDLNQWAYQLRNLADEEYRQPRYGDAATHYEEALKYWLQQNNGDALTIDELTRKVVQCRLAAGQYPQAATFSQNAIARKGSTAQEVVGPIIKNEADRLRTERDFRSAIALIDAALKMSPPLEPRHQQDLKQIRKDIDDAAPGAGGNPPAPPQPR